MKEPPDCTESWPAHVSGGKNPVLTDWLIMGLSEGQHIWYAWKPTSIVWVLPVQLELLLGQ